MNYTKLGNFEAICLIVILFINHIVLNLPQMIIDNSGTASILNCVYILILVLIFAILVTKLLKRFTGLDIIDISEYLGGKFLKILIGILCIAFLVIETAFLTRMFSKNLLLVYFENYPITFIIFLFLFVGVVANLISKKSIIKTNTILVPIALLSILLTSIFVIDLFRAERSLPILGNGADKIFLTGASNIFAFNGLFFLFFISMYFILINSRFSVFLERPEAIFIFIWTLALMSFISIAIIFCLNIFQKLSNMKEVKPLSAAIATIIFVLSMLIDNVFTLETYANAFYKYGSLILIFGVFTLVLIFANIKKRVLERKRERGKK